MLGYFLPLHTSVGTVISNRAQGQSPSESLERCEIQCKPYFQLDRQ